MSEMDEISQHTGRFARTLLDLLRMRLHMGRGGSRQSTATYIDGPDYSRVPKELRAWFADEDHYLARVGAPTHRWSDEEIRDRAATPVTEYERHLTDCREQWVNKVDHHLAGLHDTHRRIEEIVRDTETTADDLHVDYDRPDRGEGTTSYEKAGDRVPPSTVLDIELTPTRAWRARTDQEKARRAGLNPFEAHREDECAYLWRACVQVEQDYERKLAVLADVRADNRALNGYLPTEAEIEETVTAARELDTDSGSIIEQHHEYTTALQNKLDEATQAVAVHDQHRLRAEGERDRAVHDRDLLADTGRQERRTELFRQADGYAERLADRVEMVDAEWDQVLLYGYDSHSARLLGQLHDVVDRDLTEDESRLMHLALDGITDGTQARIESQTMREELAAARTETKRYTVLFKEMEAECGSVRDELRVYEAAARIEASEIAELKDRESTTFHAYNDLVQDLQHRLGIEEDVSAPELITTEIDALTSKNTDLAAEVVELTRERDQLAHELQGPQAELDAEAIIEQAPVARPVMRMEAGR